MSRLHSTLEYADVAVAIALSQTSVVPCVARWLLVLGSPDSSARPMSRGVLDAATWTCESHVWLPGGLAGAQRRDTFTDEPFHCCAPAFLEYSIPLFVVAMPVVPRPIKYQQQPILAEQKREGENEGQAFS
ncbi:hypothetical protein CMUS01_06074 [Colletotrichum musicola]|uniref:Uncharacterized protein n=1 Tax=Colletotrichum musicola TaxID=2175873 RepID=A0A8H6KNL4_9PEZI|nr:hypothetical protein CMUS01_06074 [Colletotrichum musicola]